MSLADRVDALAEAGADMTRADRIDVLGDASDHAMSNIACLAIPGEHVEALTATVLGLYGARAAALGATAAAFVDDREELAELEHARGELRAIEDALSDLGWPRVGCGGSVELVGRPCVLRELIRAALLDAANGVVDVVGRYEAGREELPAVRRAVEAVPALFGLFASFEGATSTACEQAS